MRQRQENPPVPQNAAVRNEQTLRTMWTESLKLRDEAAQLTEVQDAHAREAEAARHTARTHQTEADKAAISAKNFTDVAADLADMVNAKRAAMQLPPLVPGDPYDPPQETSGPPTLVDGSLDVAQVNGALGQDGGRP